MKIKNLGLAVILSIFGLIGPTSLLAASPAIINLGLAGNYVILSKTGVSTTGLTSVNGDIGISPAAATFITGFGLTLPSASSFSTSALVNGKIYAPGYADPAPAKLTTAILDMQNAYTDGSGRAPDVTELGAGNIGGLTLVPGVYKWSTGLTVPTSVTLTGGVSDVWIFIIAQNLEVSSAAQIILAGDAQASNIFWIVAGQTTIGTTAVFKGNILDQTAIVLNTGASLNGRALAQTAVTLDANPVALPGNWVTGQGGTITTQTTTTNSQGTTISTTNTTSSGQIISTITSVPQSQAIDPKIALQAKLDGLMVQLQNIQTQTNINSGTNTNLKNSFQVRGIAMNLSYGSRNNNVATLQQFLISENKGTAARALGNVGATSYFGTLTRSALVEFQASVGIAPAFGNFGPITRAYLNNN